MIASRVSRKFLRARRLAVPILAAAVALPLVLSAGPARAIGGFEDQPTKSDINRDKYQSAKQAIDAGHYGDAIALLNEVLKSEPRNANAWNLLAYSNRKQGRFDDALAFYRKALAIEPDHRGAHEYLGELYLDKGDLPSAEKVRAELKDICTFECDELEDLDKAIASFKAGKWKANGSW